MKKVIKIPVARLGHINSRTSDPHRQNTSLATPMPGKTSQAKLDSSPAHSPGNLLDANLLAGLLIVVIPLTIREVNSSEGGVGLSTLNLPITLEKA